MLAALIISISINMAQIQEASNRLDMLITNVVTTPAKDYSKDINYIRSIVKYTEKNNTINNLESAKISTIMSLYEQILYEAEDYQESRDEKLIKSMITNKIFADSLLSTISKK